MDDPSWLIVDKKKPKEATPCRSTGNAFKVILVGEVGVGKTSIFSRIHQPHREQPATSAPSSIGVDFCTRSFPTRKGKVTLTLWDTAGAEQYRTLTRNYYRNTHAVLLVFSLDDPSTLFSLPQWQQDITSCSPQAVQFLIANKSDLQRQVKEDSMKSFANAQNCQAAFVTSAKTGEGVEAALTKICEHLVSRSQQQSTMHSRDQLWQQGSGLQVHGRDCGKEPNRCC